MTDRSLRWACSIGAAALVFSTAPPCTGQAAGRGILEAEHVLLRAYLAALQDSGARDASRAAFLRQLRHNPTVAFVDGYWVTPIDLSAVLLRSDVRPVIEQSLPKGPSREDAARLIADERRLKQLTAFAFSARSLGEPLSLPLVAEFEQYATSEPASLHIVIAPAKDVDWEVVEYLPPLPAGLEDEDDCYFFCNDPETWDFDGDGVPDMSDEDNDNDGVEDRRDHYPYWPNASLCNCDAETFVLFVTKFASGMTKAVLAAYASVEEAADTAGIVIGSAPGTMALVRFVVPRSTLASARPARACPPADDPTVRYVDKDPDVCARLRFRCGNGEVPFSNDCGCGCRRQ